MIAPNVRARGLSRPPVLLVASGKGGVGTSIVAALHALAATERSERVLLVDASEAGGTLHHLFGARPTNSLWMLSDSRSHPDDVVMPIDDNLALVAGGTSGAAVAPSTDHERRSALMRLAHTYYQFDLIVFDGGSRLDTISAISELCEPTLLLVTSADRLALAANYALVKSVSARRVDAPIAVVANRHGEALAQEACDFLVGAASHFLGRTIDIVGAIPDDPCLQAAVGAGMTIRDSIDGSAAAEAVREVLSRVAPAPVAQRSSPIPTSNRRWS